MVSRLGEERANNQGCLMRIIYYHNYEDMIVEFQDERKEKVKTTYRNFSIGNIKNHYFANVYGVGYLGEISEELKKHRLYKKGYTVWHSMIQRSYDPKLHKNEPSYLECSVCDEWKEFGVFLKWFIDNYYELDNESVQLDKDILIKNNKIYSPETCCFIPHTINSLFTKSNRVRGLHPIGVHWVERDKVFVAQCCDGNKNTIRLGQYDDSYNAFLAYKECKERIIKEVAENYKDNITRKVYEALYAYKVEITD